MQEFAKDIRKQMKRIFVALSRSQTDVGGDLCYTRTVESARDRFRTKSSKFEELLLALRSKQREQLETVDGLLDDSFEYVPKETSDPYYYHPKNDDGSYAIEASSNQSQMEDDSLIDKFKGSLVNEEHDDNNVHLQATLQSIDESSGSLEVNLESTGHSVERDIENVEPYTGCRVPLLHNNMLVYSRPLTNARLADVNVGRGTKRKRHEPLHDVTNGLCSVVGSNGALNSDCQASSINAGHHLSSKRIKLSSDVESIVTCPSIGEGTNVIRMGRFKGLRKIGRHFKAVKAGLLNGLRNAKRGNSVFPSRNQLKTVR